MKDFKATLYDIKGYLLPGLLTLWSLSEALSLAGCCLQPNVLSFSLSVKATVALAVAYVTGHGLHAVCNYTIDKLVYSCYHSTTYFNKEFVKDFGLNALDALAASVDSRFGIALLPNSLEAQKRELIKQQYWSAFQWAMKAGIADVENFLGLTGFYRGITMAAFISGFVFVISYFYHPNPQSAGFAVALIGTAALFLTRVRRFNCYLAKSVLGNFIVK
jgi:hypothetical protein